MAEGILCAFEKLKKGETQGRIPELWDGPVVERIVKILLGKAQGALPIPSRPPDSILESGSQPSFGRQVPNVFQAR